MTRLAKTMMRRNPTIGMNEMADICGFIDPIEVGR